MDGDEWWWVDAALEPKTGTSLAAELEPSSEADTQRWFVIPAQEQRFHWNNLRLFLPVSMPNEQFKDFLWSKSSFSLHTKHQAAEIKLLL